MGEPLRIDHASQTAWTSPQARRVLLFCAQTDQADVELVRPQLELQGLRVDVVTRAFDAASVANALAADTCPTVVAVVVSLARSRHVARSLLDGFSDAAGPSHRLLVLDLRRLPSAFQQVRVLSEALEGLELTMVLGRGLRAALTASATESPRASGERRLSPCSMGTRPLRVVEPPVLLSSAVRQAAQTIPTRTRFRLAERRPGRSMSATSPDLPAI